QESRPQHMAPEQSAVVCAEILLAERRLGQNLEGALVIEIADERRDDAVLPEQEPHCFEWAPDLLRESDQLAQLVIAVDDVDLDVLVEDLLPLRAQLARIGVGDGETMPPRQELAQHRLHG